jgi:23S rRNA G2069 N7-methylase RlmK/C1962 C5-methylase RlmI
VTAFADALATSVARRQRLIDPRVVSAYRMFDGAGDGIAGVYIDRFGPAAIVNVYDDAGWTETMVTDAAGAVLAIGGVDAVYVKRFSKDRSRLGGKPPEESISPTPRAGVALPETLIVEEYGMRFEVRPYDGFSTGLFLEHREHRHGLTRHAWRRALNLFAYTCAFSVPLSASGTEVTNVDVSARYLEWGRRNHALNAIDPARVRFQRMDAMSYLNYASRHPQIRFDLVIVDPPTFGSRDARHNVKAWRAASDYPKLLRAVTGVLAPGGMIFASTNTRQLADQQAFMEMIGDSIGLVDWQQLPPWPPDFRERGRVAAALFTPRKQEPLPRPRQRRETRARPAGPRGRARARR